MKTLFACLATFLLTMCFIVDPSILVAMLGCVLLLLCYSLPFALAGAVCILFGVLYLKLLRKLPVWVQRVICIAGAIDLIVYFSRGGK